jgi:hypothetical protein
MSFHPCTSQRLIHPGTFATFGLQDAPEVDTPEDWTFFFYIAWNEEQDEE